MFIETGGEVCVAGEKRPAKNIYLTVVVLFITFITHGVHSYTYAHHQLFQFYSPSGCPHLKLRVQDEAMSLEVSQ